MELSDAGSPAILRNMAWMVYVLTSEASGATYVGITTDPQRRLAEHNGKGRSGAASTRAGRPWTLGALYGPYEDRSAASRAEHQVKRLRGPARLSWQAPPAG